MVFCHSGIRAFFACLVLCFLNAVLASDAFSSQAEVNLDDEGFVLHGYDPVSYFDDAPAPGDHSFQASYKEMNFKFSSASNKEKFLNSPSRYLPAYGGYCAFGVRMGSKFDIDPEAFEIVDGKLYVLLNRATEEMWIEDTQRNIEIANRLWPSIESISQDELQ